jgi:hypothetical protein
LNRPDWDYGDAEGRECLQSTARLLWQASGWQLTALLIWLR